MSQKTMLPQSCNKLVGVSSQFSTPCAIEFAHFTMMTLKEVDAYGCYLLLKGI